MAQYSNLIFIVAIVGIFYFLLIRPQQQRAKAQKDMLAALKPGDEIVTVGGIYATVVDVAERVRVRVLDGSELEVAKQAIGQVLSRSGSEGPAVTEDADDAVETGEADSTDA